MSSEIAYEQAVYGSFPFWERGYALLACSAGCRPGWLDALRRAGQRLGERPAGVAEAEGLFALPLPRGPMMIVGVIPQGCDDRGRPGALAFHALFVGRWAYLRSGCDPFGFASAFRRDWKERDQGRTLPGGSLVVPDREPPLGAGADERTRAIVAALRRGRRVVVPSPGPIDDLARAVWRELPWRVRRRASVATWAFTNANRFDLVAVPRPAALAPDPSEIVLGPEEPSPTVRDPRATARRRAWIGLSCLAVLLGTLGLGGVLGWWDAGRAGSSPRDRAPARPAPVSGGRGVASREGSRPPERREEPPPSPEERRRLSEALASLLERFGARAEGEPAALLARLSGRLRYAGRSLSPDEVAELRREAEASPGRSSHDAALALRWHELARRFLGDRPLPDDFESGPPRWQLAALAWSFHLDEEPAVVRALRQGTPAEVVQAIDEALTVDAPLPATSLAARHPALDDYRRFLGSLPRR